jgi:hypothetical protein
LQPFLLFLSSSSTSLLPFTPFSYSCPDPPLPPTLSS